MVRLALTGWLAIVVAALTSPAAAEQGRWACPSLAEDTQVRRVIFYDAAKPARKYEMTVPVPYLGADPAKQIRLSSVDQVPIYMYSPRLFIDHKTLCPGPPIDLVEPAFSDDQVGVLPVESPLTRPYDHVERTRQRPDGVTVSHLAEPDPEKVLFEPIGSVNIWDERTLYTFAGNEAVPKFEFRCKPEGPLCRLHIYPIAGMTVSVQADRSDIPSIRAVAQRYKALFDSFGLKLHKGLPDNGYGRWACATLRNDAPAWPIALVQRGVAGFVVPIMVPDDYINLPAPGEQRTVQLHPRMPVRWHIQQSVSVYVDYETLCPRPRAFTQEDPPRAYEIKFMPQRPEWAGTLVGQLKKATIRTETGPSGLERLYLDVDAINRARLPTSGIMATAPDAYYAPSQGRTPEVVILCGSGESICILNLFYQSPPTFRLWAMMEREDLPNVRKVMEHLEHLVASFGLGQ